MTPQRFQEIRDAFESVVSLTPTEQAAALDALHGRDQELAQEVAALLATHERRGDFIEAPAARVPPAGMKGDALPGEKWVGPYQLLDLIGEGGMGQVWRAQQAEPVQRTVAVKLIKAGMDTHEVIRRFESERQALALMEHPAIAKVFDAGTTPEGRPYFAMEYVDGVPITDYCDKHRLSIRDRLKLFIRVCEGVQHAHQKAIIHRDLKPSNILVTEVDGKAAPKIIDFGVALAMSRDDPEATILTRIGAILGTPDYMSPEQSSGGKQDIDTRADVYSLGVVLYELLVGVLPLELRGLPFGEILRKMSEADAPRPSSRMRMPEADSATPFNRRTERAALVSELRGDLDAIALKSLEKDRRLRYDSPADLAGDINRYLRNQPVTARPASASYFAGKYVRRHRVGVATAVAVLALAFSFGVWQAVQLRRITRERDRADRIAQFMTNMFRVSDPSESRGNQITAREILDKASANIGTGLANDPDLQAQMMDLMGTVYYTLGLYPQAESLAARTLQIRRRVLGPEDPKTAQSMNSLANALNAEGRRAEAEPLYREALALRKRMLGPNHPDTLKSMNNWAAMLTAAGRYPEAEQIHRDLFRIRRRLFGPEHPDTLSSMDNLANTLNREGGYTEAETLGREALEIKRRVLGPEHPDTLRAAHHLANTLYYEGRTAETEELDRGVLTIRLRILGPQHRDTLSAMIALADTLDEEHHYKEAETLDRRALDIQRLALGPEHPDSLLAMNNLAGILGDEGHYAEAEKLEREVVRIREHALGAEHTETLHSYGRLAFILMLGGSFGEAERIAHRTRELQLRLVGPTHPETAATTYTLACIAARTGRPGEALSLLRDAVDHGLRPKAALGIGDDPNLKPLHAAPGFGPVVAYARRQATAATLPH
jgi:non-specific serine/threonine protein kinase/serine/threonine-protein kinase